MTRDRFPLDRIPLATALLFLLCAGFTAALAAPNDVPYAEPFEAAIYTNGFSIAGVNGWSGADYSATISTESSVIAALGTYSGSGHAFPIATTHDKVLQLAAESTITNTFHPTTAATTVYIDFLMMPSFFQCGSFRGR